MSISMRTALRLIAQNQKNPKFKVLDVRTPEQRAVSFIPNSHHIPLNSLDQATSLLSKEDTCLVYCRSGVRSVTASNWLNSRGYNAINMEGGIIEYEKISKEDKDQPKKGSDVY